MSWGGTPGVRVRAEGKDKMSPARHAEVGRTPE